MTRTSSHDADRPPGRLDAVITRADHLWHNAERYVHGKLVWNNVYRTTSYLRSSLWVIPFLAIVLVLAIAPALRLLDAWLGWRIAGLGLSGAQSLYQTVITLTLSFIVFTFGSLLVAIQVASGQLTPRIIATTLLRNNVVRYSVGLFVFTLIFAVMALDRLDARVHDIVALMTAALGIVSMATFLFLIDYAARLLRPVSILARVGDEGLGVITSVYPNPAGDGPDVAVRPWPPAGGEPNRSARRSLRDRARRRSGHAGARSAAGRRGRRVPPAGRRLRRERRAALHPLRWRHDHR